MIFTADYLISRRKAKWEELQDIEFDKAFRGGVADELLKNETLLNEVIRNPEKLIELVFVDVDKKQVGICCFFLHP